MEVRLGQDMVDSAATNLLRIRMKVDLEPSFLTVVIDMEYVYIRDDGVHYPSRMPPELMGEAHGRSEDAHVGELLREVRVRHIVQAILGQRLLLGLLVHTEHGLDLVDPELVGEPGVGELRV